MFIKRSNKLLFTLIIMLSLFVTACSGVNKGTVSAEDEDGKTKTLSTVNGDIEIPVEPKKIVVDGYLPSLLALGIKPVGSTASDLKNVHIQNMVSGIEVIGGEEDGLSPEAILELKPDLIITLIGSGADNDKYEQISKIAPTISIPFGTYKDVHSELKALGEMLGKEKEAENWLKDYDQRVEASREKIKELIEDKETVSILGAYSKGFYVYGNGGYRGGQAIYRNLKLTPPETIQKELMDAGETFKQISFEVMKDYAGDYIFFDESYGGKIDKNNPMLQSLEAVKNDKVFYLDPDFFWPYDPIAVINQTEKVVEMLAEKR
ncbi:ABC transporter substrate-binding protein [Clostridium algidicarnis]|uniref:ABC transporter substrate-binding protein n=1 Tax=Clostridium algidicarnis TaxID=37659 RepID=UPI001C0D79BC|nr:ABC transporter substrate-binding protein [Clostridium algidicarnis]MBU3204175.1 ABC transporter substrate-binding protein [Clostridium algidicarnis]MBU3212329.1 ABC transporter substrate-binding protein [Clostridium algidicarnis]MBU3221166.1 ABC transporter substrate-binding protein [Clostridium algidicarnis]